MEEQRISFKTAVLAKEKGFDWRSEARYGTQTRILYNDAVINDLEDDVFTAAPTQSLLQKWLRDIHGIHIVILPLKDKTFKVEFTKDLTFWAKHDLFKTYEETLEIGLQEALKLINNV